MKRNIQLSIIVIIQILLIHSSCSSDNKRYYTYDPTKEEEFIVIERMNYKKGDKISQYILVKNAPKWINPRKKMMLEYAKKLIAEQDSVYKDYSLCFFRYGPETAEYLTEEYRKDWTGERYVLHSSDEAWNDTRFELGWFYSIESEKDTNLWNVYLDVAFQDFPVEDWLIGNYTRITIAKDIPHIKQLNN